MIEVNNNTVVIDLKGNTVDDKANAIRELAVAFKGVSEVLKINPKKLSKLIKRVLNDFKEDTPKEGQDVKKD